MFSRQKFISTRFPIHKLIFFFYSIKDIHHINDEAIEHIVKCTKIERLYLRRSTITDIGLKTISSRLNALKVLDISSCDHITDEGIKSFCTSSLPRFEALKIDFCTQLTPVSLAAISTGSFKDKIKYACLLIIIFNVFRTCWDLLANRNVVSHSNKY